jgi:hypothetical protein
MTSRIVLGHPYSGALYAYFSDQIGGEGSHTRVADSHPYYKTLYESVSEPTVNLSLNFLMLYDEVWIAPADNHWPRSRKDPADLSWNWELGLHAGGESLDGVDWAEQQRYIEGLLADRRIQAVLGQDLQLRPDSWRQVMQDALHDSSLSARTRAPILCSPGRRKLISTLVEVEQPSLHPVHLLDSKVRFVEQYQTRTGLSLAPRNLDALMEAKPDAGVRRYGAAFLAAVDGGLHQTAASKKEFAKAALEAIDTERVARHWAGSLNWIGRLFKLVHQPVLAGGAAGLSYFAGRSAEAAGWYEFAGKVDDAMSRAQLIRDLERDANAPDDDPRVA